MNRILKAVSPLFLALLAVSCSDDTTVSPAVGPDDSGKVNFEINVYAGDPEATGSRTSRAIDQDGYDYSYEEPTYPAENMHTLRVIIVNNETGDNDYNKVEANEYLYRAFPQDGSSRFTGIRIKLDPGKKRVYLIANEASIAALNPATDFNKCLIGTTFTSAMMEDVIISGEPGKPIIDNTGTEKLNIPMTEEFDVTIKAPETDEDYYQSADLFITRALVKFSFTAKATEAPQLKFTIDELTISSVADREYLLPTSTVYDPAKYPVSWDNRYITAYDVPADATVTDYVFPDAEFEFTTGYTVGNLYTYAPELYFAETRLPADPQEYILTLRMTEYSEVTGRNESYTVRRTLPNLPSLPRNTHVKINLTLTGGRLDCVVDVLPYTGVFLNPDFGIDRP